MCSSIRGRFAVALATLTVVLMAGGPVPAALADGATFSATGISLSINSAGKVTALRDTVTGVNRVHSPWPEYQKHMCAVRVGGILHDPTGCIINGSDVTFLFGGLSPSPEITVRIEEKPNYLVFTLTDVTNDENVEEVQFVHLYTAGSVDGAAYRFLEFNDGGTKRHMGVTPLDVFTSTSVGPGQAGGYLWGSAYPDLPYPGGSTMVGRQAALFTCGGTQADVYAAMDRIEDDYGLMFGVDSKQHEAFDRHCVFWLRINADQQDDARDYAAAFGAKRVLLLQAVWRNNDYGSQIATNWGDVATLKAWIDQSQAQGVYVGAHVFPSLVDKEAKEHIYTGCSPKLARDRTIQLAADVPADQVDGLIQTTTPPTGWPTASKHRDIVIGAEIIEYTGVKTSGPPYGFTGPFTRAKNQTGDGGLGPQAHSAGATIGHLMISTSGNFYIWDIASGGMQEWCADAATMIEAADFDWMYTDGLEAIQDPKWYAFNLAHMWSGNMLADSLLWMESVANSGSMAWSDLGIFGSYDYVSWTGKSFKEEVDSNIEKVLDFDKYGRFSKYQLGWTPLKHGTEFITPDELEYVLARSLAYDMPITWLTSVDFVRDWPLRDSNLARVRLYDDLRRGDYFSDAAVAPVRGSQKDFMLFTDGSGTHHVARVQLVHAARGSRDVRTYATVSPIDGETYVTMWPTDDEKSWRVVLSGVKPANVAVTDADGSAVAVTDLNSGQVSFPVATRVFLRLTDVPDVQKVVEGALLQEN